jgi:hypothetical protein
MSRAVKSLASLMAISAALTPNYTTYGCIPAEKQTTKERSIRKCANPKKKARRKFKQASQRKNRR